jgi:hypothetical protein
MGLEDEHHAVVIVAVIAVVVLELWRRALRGRAPRWVHAVVLVLIAATAIAIGYAQITMGSLEHRLAAGDAGDKASRLATGISDAVLGDAAAIACIVIGVIVLAIGHRRARPEVAEPRAETRR